MHHALPSAAATVAAMVVLAACGGGNDAAAPHSSGSGKTTVGVQQVDGIGRVLIDASGKALYSSDVEAGGKVLCVDACTSFWEPLTAGAGTPTGTSDAGKLGVVKRPDGTRQVTANGKLLYTFSEDSPGKVTGNGFADDFAGRHFTWNTVLAGGKSGATNSGTSRPSPGNGYGY